MTGVAILILVGTPVLATVFVIAYFVCRRIFGAERVDAFVAKLPTRKAKR